MKVNDDDHLLMIEPTSNPISIHDEITKKSEEVFSQCKMSNHSYKGFHKCSCGATSDNKDWYTPNGKKTHSLMIHYIKDHREDVPQEEIDKLLEEN